VTVVSRWVFDAAFALSPQSGLTWCCFLFPLIEPDWQISRIRLSEKTHAHAHGRRFWKSSAVILRESCMCVAVRVRCWDSS